MTTNSLDKTYFEILTYVSTKVHYQFINTKLASNNMKTIEYPWLTKSRAIMQNALCHCIVLELPSLLLEMTWPHPSICLI